MTDRPKSMLIVKRLKGQVLLVLGNDGSVSSEKKKGTLLLRLQFYQHMKMLLKLTGRMGEKSVSVILPTDASTFLTKSNLID